MTNMKPISQEGWSEKQIAAYEKIEDPKKQNTYGLMQMGKVAKKNIPVDPDAPKPEKKTRKPKQDVINEAAKAMIMEAMAKQYGLTTPPEPKKPMGPTTIKKVVPKPQPLEEEIIEELETPVVEPPAKLVAKPVVKKMVVKPAK